MKPDPLHFYVQAFHEEFKNPTKASDGSSGYDLYAVSPGIIPANDTKGTFVKLGFASCFNRGYGALLLPRSGLGAKKGLSLNNTVGLIDSDYRDEWMACFRNRNNEDIYYETGDKIVQFILVPTPDFTVIGTTSLDSAANRKGGFGSSGIK
jgi:dUTP pyrophosphatase